MIYEVATAQSSAAVAQITKMIASFDMRLCCVVYVPRHGGHAGRTQDPYTLPVLMTRQHGQMGMELQHGHSVSSSSETVAFQVAYCSVDVERHDFVQLNQHRGL